MPDGPLLPHAAPLTAADARHLLRRTGVGASPERVTALTGLTADAAARGLLDEAAASPVPADPAWVLVAAQSISVLDGEREAILRRMHGGGLREKLTLFLHNHFATEAPVVDNPYRLWRHYLLLRGSALGNFRTLVHAVGLDPAMLKYLNGNLSGRAAPNQNYARELLELFTMGQYAPDGGENYTETDVREAARALTGWRYRAVTGTNETESYFLASQFDTGTKTILGQTGAWGYDDTVRIVFEQRGTQTARFLARKMLAFFVSSVPDEAAETALAAVLMSNGFALRPAFEALFASQHFYDPGFRGALVKSPTDLYAGLVTSLATPATFDAVRLRQACRGNVAVPERSHVFFDPPNVAGWPGHNPPSATGRMGYTAWYSSDDFSTVWTNLRALARNDNGRAPYAPLALAGLAPDANDVFHVARSIAEHLMALPLAWVSVPQLDTPFGGDQTIQPPAHVAASPRYVSDLAKILLAGAPHYEWAAMPAAMKTTLLRNYVVFLTTEVPEFLLF